MSQALLTPERFAAGGRDVPQELERLSQQQEALTTQLAQLTAMQRQLTLLEDRVRSLETSSHAFLGQAASVQQLERDLQALRAELPAIAPARAARTPRPAPITVDRDEAELADDVFITIDNYRELPGANPAILRERNISSRVIGRLIADYATEQAAMIAGSTRYYQVRILRQFVYYVRRTSKPPTSAGFTLALEIALDAFGTADFWR